MDIKIELSELFKDLDSRGGGSRIVKVIEVDERTKTARVENVEHWDEKRIGRRSRFRKVSH
jgi:hypothetical protein